MKIEGSVALVTGANRGLGLAFARALLAAGAKKVYAAARDPSAVKIPGVVALKLDVTNAAEVAAAAKLAEDVTLVVNNAGILRGAPVIDAGDARAEMEVNYFGTLAVSRAF